MTNGFPRTLRSARTRLSHGLLSVAPIQFLKSAGVPLPVPIGLLMVLLGVLAREDTLSLWLAWPALTIASGLGALYGALLALTYPVFKPYAREQPPQPVPEGASRSPA